MFAQHDFKIAYIFGLGILYVGENKKKLNFETWNINSSSSTISDTRYHVKSYTSCKYGSFTSKWTLCLYLPICLYLPNYKNKEVKLGHFV